MAFALERDRRVGPGIKKVIRKQISNALSALADTVPDETAIHDARKSVKKARAIFRLLSSSDRRLGTRRRQLGEAARGLSALRDADVLAHTLGTLHARYPRVTTARVVRAIERRLRDRPQAVRQRAPLVAAAREALERTRRKAPGLVQRAARPRAIREGIRLGYERTRDVFRSLTATSGASELHRWRRRVKEHWYHVRLLEDRHPALRKRSRELHALEEALGQDHDLELLRRALLELRPPEADGVAAVVLGCIDQAQARLRRSALPLGRRLFDLKPKHLERLVRESLAVR
jgi:hypothetical protein